MYRIVKKPVWWTIMFHTEQPQFLYWDERIDHFDVGCYSTVRTHKWTFSKEEVKQIEKDYPDIRNNFMIRKESVRNATI